MSKFTEVINDLFTHAFEYDGNSMVIYKGDAKPGVAKSAIGWRIAKFTYSGNNCTDIQWAGGDNSLSKVWDDRASYTYS